MSPKRILNFDLFYLLNAPINVNPVGGGGGGECGYFKSF